jgi:hypothetical protein
MQEIALFRASPLKTIAEIYSGETVSDNITKMHRTILPGEQELADLSEYPLGVECCFRHSLAARGIGETHMADTKNDASDAVPGRAFVSDGIELTLLEEVPWDSKELRAALSIALEHEHFISDGGFAIVHGRHTGAYTGRRLGGVSTHLRAVLKVVFCEGRWIAIGPPGTEPREIFSDGRSHTWEGPVPVEALA